MVEANPLGDGLVRNTNYGKWREDKEAEEGYSKELIAFNVEPQFYDNLAGLEILQGPATLLECFQAHVANRGDQPFLGRRPQVGTNDKGPVFGDYQWEDYR